MLPSDAVLPPGSLVLVTGANGFVATHVIDQLLAHGYRVRGTIRDVQKSAWMRDIFAERYGPDKLELVSVKDLGVQGSLDQAVKDPNEVVNTTVTYTAHALESAAKEPSLERFVYCSSSSAANQMRLNERFDLTPESWNGVSVERAWRPPPYEADRIIDVYNASKVAAEKAVWAYVREQKPHFTVNSVLPDFVTGAPLSVEKQGYPSSLSTVKALYDGADLYKILPPQWMIDVRDAALLHVAALVHPEVKSERVFGYAHNKTWTDWIARYQRMYPDHTWPEPPKDEGKDMSNVTGQGRAESLLRWMGETGWRPMEDSMREAVDAIIGK